MSAAQEQPENVRMYLANRSGGQWIESVSGEDDDRKKILAEILLSRNLVVLSGLGTTRYLKKPDNTQAAPTMQDLWDILAEDADFKRVRQTIDYPTDDSNIEQLLSRCQLWQAIKPEKSMEGFIARAEQIIVKQCRFVTDELPLDTHETFLRKVGRRSTRLPRMKLFTTNYDLAIETAARNTSFIVVDGFSHTLPQEFDSANFNYDFVRREDERDGPEYISNVFHLYKIHGSVDWELRNSRVMRADEPKFPVIIYPRNGKFESSYNPPFLEMMSRFQLALRQPDTGILIIGFGFNDEHLSQPILSAIRSNIGIKAAVISPDLQTTTNPHIEVFARLIKNGDDRLALLATSFENIVAEIPDLVAATEEEEHRYRIASAMKRK